MAIARNNAAIDTASAAAQACDQPEYECSKPGNGVIVSHGEWLSHKPDRLGTPADSVHEAKPRMMPSEYGVQGLSRERTALRLPRRRPQITKWRPPAPVPTWVERATLVTGNE